MVLFPKFVLEPFQQGKHHMGFLHILATVMHAGFSEDPKDPS